MARRLDLLSLQARNARDKALRTVVTAFEADLREKLGINAAIARARDESARIQRLHHWRAKAELGAAKACLDQSDAEGARRALDRAKRAHVAFDTERLTLTFLENSLKNRVRIDAVKLMKLRQIVADPICVRHYGQQLRAAILRARGAARRACDRDLSRLSRAKPRLAGHASPPATRAERACALALAHTA